MGVYIGKKKAVLPERKIDFLNNYDHKICQKMVKKSTRDVQRIRIWNLSMDPDTYPATLSKKGSGSADRCPIWILS
jgi:hypothetical protein